MQSVCPESGGTHSDTKLHYLGKRFYLSELSNGNIKRVRIFFSHLSAFAPLCLLLLLFDRLLCYSSRRHMLLWVMPAVMSQSDYRSVDLSPVSILP